MYVLEGTLSPQLEKGGDPNNQIIAYSKPVQKKQWGEKYLSLELGICGINK